MNKMLWQGLASVVSTVAALGLLSCVRTDDQDVRDAPPAPAPPRPPFAVVDTYSIGEGATSVVVQVLDDPGRCQYLMVNGPYGYSMSPRVNPHDYGSGLAMTCVPSTSLRPRQ